MRIAGITRLLAFTSLRASTSRYLAERPSIVLVVAGKPVPATIKPEPMADSLESHKVGTTHVIAGHNHMRLCLHIRR